MLSLFPFHQQFFRPNSLQTHPHFNLNNPVWWRRQNSVGVVRCNRNGVEESKSYYELLGLCVDASPQEIKDAYRKLQKKYHPDIAGEKGHESTLMLNKAYKVLMKDDLRKQYDASIGKISDNLRGGSIWEGSLRPQALFVDENACIGCRECVHHAGNTFMMDEIFGTARVKVQYGDDEERIEISVDSCPVNCIHWVDTEELEVLEYLIQPQAKVGYGIYGQGWERPANVFMAAKSFNKQLKQQEENQQRCTKSTDEEETPAQAQARESAYRELKVGRFARLWSWMKRSTSQ
ncbi:Chaperone protein dnaJ C76, chloroplastic [Sesamum angolense]|uniref:Chaperone protein dnaJ C76, chloroplastic n=1 Tax=Sesamum angolense TaxID=2727404 RepID=A0AAE1WGT5_9LAMI|nr:Chaperone protein dnaJ C76, chloroplastic [Sesamum angolense]